MDAVMASMVTSKLRYEMVQGATRQGTKGERVMQLGWGTGDLEITHVIPGV